MRMTEFECFSGTRMLNASVYRIRACPLNAVTTIGTDSGDLDSRPQHKHYVGRPNELPTVSKR
jgi:hypothetical protein